MLSKSQPITFIYIILYLFHHHFIKRGSVVTGEERRAGKSGQFLCLHLHFPEKLTRNGGQEEAHMPEARDS